MHTIYVERQTITMDNVNFGQPVKQEPRSMIVLTPADIKESSKGKPEDELELYDDFNVQYYGRHTADFILFFRTDGKIVSFKARNEIIIK